MGRAIVEKSQVSVFTLPTPTPMEADGTLEWSKTTMILLELFVEGQTALGYTYGHPAIATVVQTLVDDQILGQNVFEGARLWGKISRAVRNDGKFGLTAMAISAIDMALWDAKARLWNAPLADVWGRYRDRVEVYGSGGFTSLTPKELEEQLRGWRDLGIRKVKIKVGTNPAVDPERVAFVRSVMGAGCEIMVDANEALDVAQASRLAEIFDREGVTWFEQPVSACDSRGLKALRSEAPRRMRLATGEYIYDVSQTLAILEAGAADAIQLDVTRCKGPTGFFESAALARAFHRPVSSHCAPALHAAIGCALPGFLHVEYFSDHARFEAMAFEGAPRVRDGFLESPEAPGLGLRFRHREMERYRQ